MSNEDDFAYRSGLVQGFFIGLVVGFVSAILLTWAVPANAQTEDEKLYCAAVSTWVNVVVLQRVQNVPAEQVIPNIEAQQPLSEEMKPLIQGIIETVYFGDMPPVHSGAEVASVIDAFYTTCLEQYK